MDDERVEALWKTYRRTSDIEARNALIETYLPLCRAIAAGLCAHRGGLQAEYLEYVQMATLGLIDAVDHYDPGQGGRFEAYAAPRVRGAVLNGLRSLSERHEQVSLKKRLHRQRLASLRERSESRRESTAEAGAHEDLFERLSRLTLGLAIGYMLEGTNMMVDVHRSPMPHQEFYDSAAFKERREQVHRLVKSLPTQERRVLEYHYLQGLTFVEVARLLDLSTGRVSQLHRQALEHLREKARAAGLDVSI